MGGPHMTDLSQTPTDPAATEARRLARLRQLAALDSDPESVFDGLVAAAAAICGTPISLVSLVDEDRQWFKANRGLDGVTETPREVAFCAHAIEGDTVMATNLSTTWIEVVHDYRPAGHE